MPPHHPLPTNKPNNSKGKHSGQKCIILEKYYWMVEIKLVLTTVGSKDRQNVQNFLKGTNGKKYQNVQDTIKLFLQAARIMIGSGKSSIYRSASASWLPAIVNLLLLLLLYRRWFQSTREVLENTTLSTQNAFESDRWTVRKINYCSSNNFFLDPGQKGTV